MYSLILHVRRSQNLRLLGASLQNAFSSVTDVSPRRKGKTFSVSYLVDSLGLTPKIAQSISKKVISSEGNNPDSVLSLLQVHGFTDSQISTIVSSYPLLLTLDAENSLAPKLQFLQSRGSDEFTEIVSKVPKILGMKQNKTLSVYYDFAKEIIECGTSSLPQGTRQENKMRTVSTLREFGVPQKLLFSFLTSGHVSHNRERFEESIKKVVEMGFDPKTSKFLEALCVLCKCSGEALEEKVNLYKRLGFGVSDVWAMFKKHPSVLAYSGMKIVKSYEGFIGLGFSRDEFATMFKCCPQRIGLSTDSVQKKTEFLVEKMNWSLKALAMNPAVFGLSMEKRIAPRCNVIKALMSKGLLGSKLPLALNVLVCTDETFFKRYVKKHDDKQLVAELMAIFTKDHKAQLEKKKEAR